MKRFDHRARVSASMINRTLALATGPLQTFQCSEWGNSYNGGIVYQRITGAGLNYLSGDVVDKPGIGWWIDPATRPSWTATYATVRKAYSDASVYRSNVGTLTPSVTGAQLLLNGSPLKVPHATKDVDALVYVKSDRLRIEDPDSEEITLVPDNWGTPGRGIDSMGKPWSQNPASEPLTTPFWLYCDAKEHQYDWYPAVGPSGPMSYGVWGGCNVLTPGHPTYGYEYGAGIYALAGQIGLPMELQVGPVCRIVEAKAELSFTGMTIAHKTFSRPTYGDVGVVTTSTTTAPLAMVLLAGKTAIIGDTPYTTWDIIGNVPAGTATVGKTCVVDVTKLLQLLVDHSADDYDSFALLPSVGVEYLGGPNLNALRGLLGEEPTIAWDETAGEWFVTSAVHTETNWDSYTLSAPVVTVEWPASVLGRHVLPLQWPPMD